MYTFDFSAQEKYSVIGSESIIVSRKELLDEHSYLLSRLQQLRRLLNLDPLPTGKQLRREKEVI